MRPLTYALDLLQMPLNDCVEVKAGGIHGFCWFAGEDIKAGTWIWKARAPGAPHTDRFFTTEQLAQLDPAVRDKFMSLAYQVEDNLYLGLDPDKEPIPAEQNELFVNHSCDGNCWYEVSTASRASSQQARRVLNPFCAERRPADCDARHQEGRGDLLRLRAGALLALQSHVC